MKNRIIYILACSLLAASSCTNYFDEHMLGNDHPAVTDVRPSMSYTLTDDDIAAIGKQCTYKAKDTVPSVYELKALSLCTEDDSTAYIEWKKIASLKAFTEEAAPDIYVPMFMADKFPYLNAGTMCNVTYRLYEGKSQLVAPFNAASTYALTDADYQTIWGGRGAAYLNDATEAKIPDFLKNMFKTAAEGKIMIVSYTYKQEEPAVIYPPLTYACTVAELLEAQETVEHQLTGTVGTVKSTIYGRFYLVDGSDSIYVYGVTDESGNRVWRDKGIQVGDQITIKGNFALVDGQPQFNNAVYVSHTSQASPSPRRAKQAIIEDGLKQVPYQLVNGQWQKFESEQLYAIEVLPQSVYTSMDVTNISDPAKTIGDFLHHNYPYAQEKQVYLIIYYGNAGLTADEWVFDGADFVMRTGYTTDVMSFVLNKSWVANISTFYTTPFVENGQADFTIQNVELNGIGYVWRYQKRYGMTASAYYQTVNYAAESWLVSPNIRLKKSEHPELTFYHAVRYGNPEQNPDWLKVMVTNNYTGDVTTTEWEHLAFPDSIPDGSNWIFMNAGRFDLSKYNGQTIVLGFQYNTTVGELKSAPTWEIQDLLVAEKAEVDAFIVAGNEKRGIKQ